MDMLGTILESACWVKDTDVLLALLKEHRSAFLDPFSGFILHAEVLYQAIKCNNTCGVKALAEMNIQSDIAFYKHCGNTPIGLALEDKLPELLPILFCKADKRFALAVAIKRKHQELVHFLLKRCHFSKRFLNFLETQLDLQ